MGCENIRGYSLEGHDIELLVSVEIFYSFECRNPRETMSLSWIALKSFENTLRERRPTLRNCNRVSLLPY